jgi:hypothetical protein
LRKKNDYFYGEKKGAGMSLPETVSQMSELIAAVARDLVKVGRGNKSAAQRVRTGTIKLERAAKIFRRESVRAEKSGKFKKRKAAPRRAKRRR